MTPSAGEPLATLNGWTVVATLRHRAGRPTSVQLTVPGALIDTDAWSRSEGWCEHCRTRRARRTTYLLRGSDGRLAQVGSSCVADFTALRRPHAGGVRAQRRPRHTGSSTASTAAVDYVDLRAFLAHVAQAVFDFGFVSSAAATRRQPATWATALARLDRGRAPSVKAAQRARQALEWVRADLSHRDRLDRFERRLVELVAQDRLTYRELPTAAAAVYAFHQHLRRTIAAREREAS